MLINSCIHTYICARLRAGLLETGCGRGMEGTSQKTIAIKETIKNDNLENSFMVFKKNKTETCRVQCEKFRLALRRK